MLASDCAELHTNLIAPVLYTTAWSVGRSLVSMYVFTLSARTPESIASRINATAMGRAQRCTWMSFILQKSRMVYASGLTGLTAPSSAA